MSEIAKDTDKGQAALKWLALAVLHGINANAEKISLAGTADGSVTARAEYREAELPSPGGGIGQEVIAAVRQITHFEGEKGQGPLALGVRNDSLEIDVQVERDDKGETVTLRFPKSK
jgi:hypothetical protein